jgi:hypothetical protein
LIKLAKDYESNPIFSILQPSLMPYFSTLLRCFKFSRLLLPIKSNSVVLNPVLRTKKPVNTDHIPNYKYVHNQEWCLLGCYAVWLL